jgi:hypothetical protein
MTPEVDVAVSISVVALAVSLLSLFVAWRAYERDRSDLKITADFHLQSGQGTAFQVHLVNRGRRPIQIENVLLRLKSGEALTLKRVVAEVVLDENETCDYWFPLFDYRGEIDSPLDISQAEAYDTHGKRHLFPFSRLKKRISEEWTPETDCLKKAKE